MSAAKYHGLFVMNSWSHMVMGLLSGFLIDRFGNAKMAVFFAVLFVIGQTMFSLGAHISSYSLMLVGRSVYSLGSGPIQSTYTREKNYLLCSCSKCYLRQVFSLYWNGNVRNLSKYFI